MGATDSKPNNNQDRDENAVKLLRVLFHDVFCPAENVPDERKAQVLPVYFYGWLDKEWTTLDQEELSTKAGTDEDTWAFVRRLLESGTAPEATAAIWYTIVLAGRPKPPVEVASINLVCNVTFADKSISTTQAFVCREMFTGPGFDDALFFTVVRNVMKQAIESMMGSGLAGLHQEAAKNQFTSEHPNDPFEVLMGWVIKHMIRGEPMPGKLAPQLAKPVETYMRLAQQCIRPPIPEHIINQFRVRQAQEQGKEAGKPRGGWNV